MTNPAIANQAATVVPEARRMEFLPDLFGRKLMLIGERTVFEFMSWLASDDYAGGLWNFYEFDGRPLFLAPASEQRFRIACDTNGYQGEVSAEAAGIVATLFALSHLSFQHSSEPLSDCCARLYDYAADHAEAREIFQAID
jgi:hypothetical protein